MVEQTPTSSGRGARFWVTIMLGGAAAILIVCIGVTLFGLWIADRQGEPGDPVAGITEVEVQDDDFDPDSIEIEPNTTVTWTWVGNNDHNVYSDAFESPVQEDGTFEHTFVETGTYDYECTIHPGMRGRVIVTEETA